VTDRIPRASSADLERPERKLHVAIVTGQLEYGGAERQVTELALNLPAHGVVPHVFCLGGSDEPFGPVLRAAGIRVSRISRSGGFDVARVMRLAHAFRGGAFDLVHSFLIDTNPYTFFAGRLAGIRRFLASNRNVSLTRGPVRRRIDSVVFRKADSVVVNALAVRDFTAAHFGIAEDRFQVVYNGVDLERFRPETGIPSGRPAIGTIGSLHPKKNPALFGEVCVAVRARFPDVRCIHVGGGELRDELAARFGAAVEFRGTSFDVERFLPSLDVFLLTSDREGCPNVLLEAMACGVPCVSTDAGGAPEVLRDGVSGFIVPRGDAGALVDRTLRLLGEPELRRAIGGAARHRVEERFSIRRMVEEFVDLYRQTALPRTHAAT
jgi:glycosyltransferase involved in cell wall biosynthesis